MASGVSWAVADAERKLAENAEVHIRDEEVKKAYENIQARIAAGKEKLAKQGKILQLQQELEKANTDLVNFMSDRDNVFSPAKHVERKALGDAVSKLSNEIAELEKEPEAEEKFPHNITSVTVRR